MSRDFLGVDCVQVTALDYVSELTISFLILILQLCQSSGQNNLKLGVGVTILSKTIRIISKGRRLHFLSVPAIPHLFI